MERSIKSAQTHPRLMSLTLTTTGTPAVSGSDKNQVSSVVDNATGDVTIIFKRPFSKIPECVISVQGSTQIHAQVKAKDVDRVTVLFKTVGVPSVPTDPAAVDGVVDLLIFGTDDRFYR